MGVMDYYFTDQCYSILGHLKNYRPEHSPSIEMWLGDP